MLRALEEVGVRFEVTGIDVIKQLDTPCIVISNHMSVLESLIQLTSKTDMDKEVKSAISKLDAFDKISSILFYQMS